MVDTVELLRSLSDAFGPPGGEEPVADLVREHLTPFCRLERDGLGSVLAEKSGQQEHPRLMLAAHMDEIGFMVQAVTPQGYLRLHPLGAWVPGLVPGQRLIIQGSSGFREGVVATVPIHFIQGEKKEVKIEDLYLDMGARSAGEVREMGVQLGDLIVPKADFAIMNQNFLVNKAWDDRVGVAAMVTAMLQLEHQAHSHTVVAVATVQEEVGVRGATTAVERVRPDLAIVLEGPPADDYPGLTSDGPQGALGAGCQIRLFDPSIIVLRSFWQWVVGLAQKRAIPYQLAVRRSGSTDARAIHLARGGIPTLILGVPVRYAHSAAGIIHQDDFKAMVSLLAAVMEELSPEVVEGW
jgi:putative aminopeptidase FrvX